MKLNKLVRKFAAKMLETRLIAMLSCSSSQIILAGIIIEFWGMDIIHNPLSNIASIVIISIFSFLFFLLWANIVFIYFQISKVIKRSQALNYLIFFNPFLLFIPVFLFACTLLHKSSKRGLKAGDKNEYMFSYLSILVWTSVYMLSITIYWFTLTITLLMDPSTLSLILLIIPISLLGIFFIGLWLYLILLSKELQLSTGKYNNIVILSWLIPFTLFLGTLIVILIEGQKYISPYYNAKYLEAQEMH